MIHLKHGALCALISTILMFGGLASAAQRTLTADEAQVKAMLEKKLPEVPIQHVQKLNFGGLYEVMISGQLVYVDAKTNHMLAGALFDISKAPGAMVNLTEKRMNELHRVDVASLPLKSAIKRVKGDGSRVLYLFSDVDCPFCARMENTLKEINNVTIYTFLLPLASLHPDAERKSRQIWCAKDRAKAWEDYFASKKLPDNKGDCDAPIAEIQALAESYGINGTPGLVFANGKIVPGAMPKDAIEALLSEAK